MSPRYPTGASIRTPVETAVSHRVAVSLAPLPAGSEAAVPGAVVRTVRGESRYRRCAQAIDQKVLLALDKHSREHLFTTKPNRKRARLCRRHDRKPGREADHPVPMPAAGRGCADAGPTWPTPGFSSSFYAHSRARLCRPAKRANPRHDRDVSMPVAGRGCADRPPFAWPVTCGILVGFERLGQRRSSFCRPTWVKAAAPGPVPC